MTRFGLVMLLAIVAIGIGFGAMVRLTGPGMPRRQTGVPAEASQPQPRARLVLPVRGVAAAALLDSFADPRGGGTRAHHAIDIPAPRGTPVLAAADGRVETLFTSAAGGLTIYERSPDGGTIYYYAHLDRYAPQLVAGQTVRAGAVIASVGATGDAAQAAPHLHFEVHRMMPGQPWWQGREVDPYPLLRAGRAGA